MSARPIGGAREAAMGWTSEELRDALRRYEQQCEDAGMRPNAVHSYVDYGRRFLRWRDGDYRPRDGSGTGCRRTFGRASVEELMGDIGAYEGELRAAHLQPRAVQTYVVHARQFTRWLDGRFVPGARLGGSPAARPEAPTTRRTPNTSVPSRGGAPDLAWAREDAVQGAVVAWLQMAGWTIERAADTANREHGEDVVARSGDRRLAVEVKGYPQATYERGEKAGTPKKWHPAGQARTYFATAVHTALVMRDAQPGTEVAIALPDVPGYRGLLRQVEASLAELAVRVFVVGPGGSVRELATRPA